MRKSYKFKKKVVQQKRYNFNQRIRGDEISVIDEEGNHLGIMTPAKGLEIAQEKGLDLVEVSPVAKPPVCKIMDFGSFKYQKEKQAKKQKKQAKSLEVKSIRISMKIGEHDEMTRIKQANKFLEKGHKIKVELILRGREFTHMNLAREKVRAMRDKFEIPTIVEQDVTKQGNKLFIILIPEKQ